MDMWGRNLKGGIEFEVQVGPWSGRGQLGTKTDEDICIRGPDGGTWVMCPYGVIYSHGLICGLLGTSTLLGSTSQ